MTSVAPAPTIDESRKVEATFLLRDGMQSLVGDESWFTDPSKWEEACYQAAMAGFTRIEVGGGRQFEIALRNGVNPYTLIRAARRGVERAAAENGQPRALLQMLFRGANGLGMGPQHPSVLEETVRLHREAGIDIIRNFDAGNDTKNRQVAQRAIEKYNKKVKPEDEVINQVAIAYANPEGGPYNNEHYIRALLDAVRSGAHEVCLKDMAGQITPENVTDIVLGFREQCQQQLGKEVPIFLHMHSSDHEGSKASWNAAISAGVASVEVGVAPLSGGSAHHDVRTFADRITGLNEDHLESLEGFLKKEFPQEKMVAQPPAEILAEFARYGIPGGAYPAIVQYLNAHELGQLLIHADKAPAKAKAFVAIFTAEVARVTKDAGFPLLVTPYASFVCAQAIFNIGLGRKKFGIGGNGKSIADITINPGQVPDSLEGRYTTIVPEFANMVLGHFGRMPVFLPDGKLGESTASADFRAFVLEKYPQAGKDMIADRKHPDNSASKLPKLKSFDQEIERLCASMAEYFCSIIENKISKSSIDYKTSKNAAVHIIKEALNQPEILTMFAMPPKAKNPPDIWRSALYGAMEWPDIGEQCRNTPNFPEAEAKQATQFLSALAARIRPSVLPGFLDSIAQGGLKHGSAEGLRFLRSATTNLIVALETRDQAIERILSEREGQSGMEAAVTDDSTANIQREQSKIRATLNLLLEYQNNKKYQVIRAFCLTQIRSFLEEFLAQQAKKA